MPGINSYMSTKRLTNDDFISRCYTLYGQAYSYEKTQYKNNRSNVTVTCLEHGDFTKNARALLQGSGCKECNTKWKEYLDRRRFTTDEFIQKSIDLHEGFYSYDNVEYLNSRTNVTITCPIHGNFEQKAGAHLEGYGCKKCGDLKHGDYRPWFISTYFDKFPDKRDIPAILYLLYSEEEDFYKVGITTKENVTERTKYMAHYNFEVISQVKDTMYNVSVAEQQILSETESYKPKYRFGGYSECIKNFVNIHMYVPNKVGNLIKEG